MYNAAVLFHDRIGILRVEAGLVQHVILIKEHLPCSPRRPVKMVLYIRIDGKKYHTDIISHIRQSASLIASVCEVVAGGPGIASARRL